MVPRAGFKPAMFIRVLINKVILDIRTQYLTITRVCQLRHLDISLFLNINQRQSCE